MKTIIWLACSPRSCGNAIALLLQEAGAETCRRHTPVPNDFNPQYGHDPDLEALVGHVQGCGIGPIDSHVTNPGKHSNPEISGAINPYPMQKSRVDDWIEWERDHNEACVELQLHVQKKCNQAKSHYLIYSHTLAGWYKRVLPLLFFTTNIPTTSSTPTRHIMVTTVRDRSKQALSLSKMTQARDGRSVEECTKYLDRFDSPLALMERDFIAHKFPVVKLTVNDPSYSVMETPLTSMLLTCGLLSTKKVLNKWTPELVHN